MFNRSRSTLMLLAMLAAPATADFGLDWYTVDAGGAMFTTDGQPGGLELSGTIGQPDAGGPLTGGNFELTGGFWVRGGPAILVGDLNCDGLVNFGDITPFVKALSDPDGYAQQYPNCPFGNRDINQDGLFNFGDITPFVNLLSQN